MQVSVYLYTLQSEKINSASFVLPDECFVSGQVFKKKPEFHGFLLRREETCSTV